MVFPLAKPEWDHMPCVVNIDTIIPKAKIFRFENYSVDMPGFLECVNKTWRKPSCKKSCVAIIVDKLKYLRYELKHWQKGLSKLKFLIQKCNEAIFILDALDDKRALSVVEFNFRGLVKLHLEELLLVECNYWKKRCTIRWIKMGEDNTKFFMLMQLRGLGEIAYIPLSMRMVEKLMIILKWLGCFVNVIEIEWAHLNRFICSLISVGYYRKLMAWRCCLDHLKEMDDIIKYMPVDLMACF
jgi:hypothetical protein